MSAAWIIGLTLAVLGAIAPRTVPEPAARRLAGVGLLIALADTLRRLA